MKFVLIFSPVNINVFQLFFFQIMFSLITWKCISLLDVILKEFCISSHYFLEIGEYFTARFCKTTVQFWKSQSYFLNNLVIRFTPLISSSHLKSNCFVAAPNIAFSALFVIVGSEYCPFLSKHFLSLTGQVG